MILAVCFLIIYNLGETGADTDNPGYLKRALEVTRYFEDRSRTLQQNLESEQLRRKIAEQTITALSENIREQDEQILDQQQQLAFYRQLLEERGRTEVDTVIRSFEIVPDYRENFYQLSAVLVRGTGISEPFEGKLDLTLFLRDASGVSFDHAPTFEPAALDVKFRYYHEIQAVFFIPAGTDILNGQLVLYDDQDNPLASQILADLAP